MLDGMIQSTRRAYDKLGKTLYHLEMMKKAGVEPETLNEAMLQAESEGEKLTLLLRSMPTYTPMIHAVDQIDEVIKEVFEIKAEFTEEGWFKLTIPYLLPKKESGGLEYLRRPIYLALQDFFKGKDVLRYKEAVIVYRHIYSIEYPKRRMRDHDNIETNAVSDAVAMFLLESDSPICCSHYETSTVGEKEKTEVFVLNQYEFPAWIVKYKSEMLYKRAASVHRQNRRDHTAKESHYNART